jgi:hypothetical protein
MNFGFRNSNLVLPPQEDCRCYIGAVIFFLNKKSKVIGKMMGEMVV